MAELVFIGIGLFDDKDLTIRGLSELQTCDSVFAEFYTSKLHYFDQKKLEEKIGKTITVLNRDETEDGSRILQLAATQKTGFIICGDPMMATTHIDLRIRAIKEGIKTKIVHNASIITAAPGLLGLQNYKFGRTTTLAYPKSNYFPMSPYDVIRNNKKMGMHTLVLLDIQSDKQRYMTANEGLNLLLQMEEQYQENIVSNETIACVISQAGRPRSNVFADVVTELLRKDFGQPLHTIVIPGTLHFMEIEALEICASLPHELALKLQKL
jgi:diphthine synthase